jgi:RluA family pseudouridine synthase
VFLNIAAYRFVALPAETLPGLRKQIRDEGIALRLKGTVLLSTEGINLFVAGEVEPARQWLDCLKGLHEFRDLAVKESYSEHQPFNRMLVKIKKEIISLGVKEIEPAERTSPKLTPTELRQWLDEGREFLLLDVRNNYEVSLGTFAQALPIGIDHFRQFPAAVAALPHQLKQKPVVMFCTGGIRCEKAGPIMEHAGYQVHQLEGGILKYFEVCGDAHYQGDCFVFDKRVAVRPNLEPSDKSMCFSCQHVLTQEDMASPFYRYEQSCPFCYQDPLPEMRSRIDRRQAELVKLIAPLPGSQPYDNIRPINIPMRLDRWSLLDALCMMFPHDTRLSWLEVFAQGNIRRAGQPVTPERIVRAGERFQHVFPNTVEPDVCGQFKILWEDDCVVVVDKPAPLPMHPSGRFHRNTLSHLLSKLYVPQTPIPVHRLDANTTGVVIFARTRRVASLVQPQFERGTVRKAYLARVLGIPAQEEFECRAMIGIDKDRGRTRVAADHGKESVTHFRVRRRFSDGTTLLEVSPKTGRTNQIRAHLAHLHLPIQGDPVYPLGGQTEPSTLAMNDPPMCLHALQIELEHPGTKQRHTWTSPEPSWVAG